MKKKDVMKIKRYFFFSLLVLFTSCSDWLDVTPKDIVDEEDLLKSHLGYRNALNGVYKQMGEIGMYGKELTWGFVDVLANPYYLGSSYIGQYHAYNKVANYKYADTDVKSYIESIWTLTYNSIANCNNIIGTIEDADSMMFPMGNAEKNLIMGEAYGLRALLHFDMLRLFAPAPVMDDNKLYIPYFDRFPSYGENNLTVTEVLNRVVADLIKARDLVASYDTLSDENVLRLTVNGGNFDVKDGTTNYQPDDVFYAYRGYRMNYPAIISLLARVYNYAGKHDVAFGCVNEIMNLKDPYDKVLYSFPTRANVLTDRKMKQDLIFALSSPKLYENYLPYATDHGYSSGDARFVLKDWSVAFDDPADYRKDVLSIPLTSTSSYYMPARNIQISSETNDICPIIRYSELYYILAEYYASKGNWSEAVNQLDKVREGRNCTKGRLTNVNNYESFRTELLKEVKREYITEGQLFFYHKKLNVKCSNVMTIEDFVLPLPESENIN